MRLEPVMWEALEEICRRENRTIHDIGTLVDARRRESSLTAAMRVFILGYFRAAVTEQGHTLAGHGPLYQSVEGTRPRFNPARPHELRTR
jgi:predicted DNA-binding ribbon-helix-helix protein